MLHMYFFVAPNPIDVTSIVIEKLIFCNDHVRVTWKVHKYNVCSYVYCEHNKYMCIYIYIYIYIIYLHMSPGLQKSIM